jgi:hypothetical protein
MEEEIWRDIPEFEGYQVSNLGRVKGTVKIMKPYNERHGYTSFKLVKDGKYHKKYLHTLLATVFIANPDNKLNVDHINRIKNDNRIENLRWVNSTENNLNTIRHDRELYGIYWYENRQSYLIKLKVNNKVKYLGWRKDINDAKELRDSGKQIIEKEFCHIFNN